MAEFIKVTVVGRLMGANSSSVASIKPQTQLVARSGVEYVGAPADETKSKMSILKWKGEERQLVVFENLESIQAAMEWEGSVVKAALDFMPPPPSPQGEGS